MKVSSWNNLAARGWAVPWELGPYSCLRQEASFPDGSIIHPPPEEISLQNTNINFITHSLALSISQRKVTTAVQVFPLPDPKQPMSRQSGWIAQTRSLQTSSPDVARNCLDFAISEEKTVNFFSCLHSCCPSEVSPLSVNVLLTLELLWKESCYQRETRPQQ